MFCESDADVGQLVMTNDTQYLELKAAKVLSCESGLEPLRGLWLFPLNLENYKIIQMLNEF